MDGLAIVIVLIIMVMGYFMFMQGKPELMSNYYLDDIAMAYSDPTLMTYTGREKDVLGNSARDYYLENTRNYLNGVAPGYFEGDSAFVNETSYLDMPAEYRPRSRASTYAELRPLVA